MFADLLTEELGYPKDTGEEYRYNCPFCGEQKNRLYLHVAEDERKGLWHCFHCGEQGNPVSFTMKYYHIGFNEALDTLETYDYSFENRNIQPKDDSLTDEEYVMLLLINQKKEKVEEETKLKPPPLPIGFKLLSQNLRSPEAYPFLLYAHSRGFTLNDIYTHNIGYVIDSSVPLPSGKVVRLMNHLVFLTHGNDGNMQYWNTRAIEKSFVKSINAPSKEGEYSKKTVVFNLNRARFEDSIVINEGVPDALTVGPQGVATFGKQVTDYQVKLITGAVSSSQRIYILLDMDAKKEMEKLAKKLYSLHEETYIVINPTGYDANSLGHDKVWEIINTYSVKADSLGTLKLELSEGKRKK